MGSNAEHQAAWRERQRGRLAGAEAEVARLREGLAAAEAAIREMSQPAGDAGEVAVLRERVAQLEAENAWLRGELDVSERDRVLLQQLLDHAEAEPERPAGHLPGCRVPVQLDSGQCGCGGWPPGWEGGS